MFDRIRELQKQIEEFECDGSLAPKDEAQEGDIILGELSPFYRKVFCYMEHGKRQIEEFNKKLDDPAYIPSSLEVEEHTKLQSEAMLLQQAFAFGMFRELAETTYPEIWWIVPDHEMFIVKGWLIVAKEVEVEDEQQSESEPDGDVVFTADKELRDTLQKKDRKKMN